MSERDYNRGESKEEIFSKVLRAGKRTYFFDVRETRAGDYYLTITESKKNQNNDGSFYYKKHKIYLYKEDFKNFVTDLNEVTDFIVENKGEEVISERHQSDYIPSSNGVSETVNVEAHQNGTTENGLESYTDVNFDEI